METCRISYRKRIASPGSIQDAWGWCTGMTRRDGTATLMAENEEELKSLLKVKEESENVGIFTFVDQKDQHLEN